MTNNHAAAKTLLGEFEEQTGVPAALLSYDGRQPEYILYRSAGIKPQAHGDDIPILGKETFEFTVCGREGAGKFPIETSGALVAALSSHGWAIEEISADGYDADIKCYTKTVFASRHARF